MAIAPPGHKRTESPRRYDMRALWTLCGWGSAAALALLAVALTSLTDRGSDRLRLAASAPPAMPAHAVVALEEPAVSTPRSDPFPRKIVAKQEQVKTTAIRPEILRERKVETDRLAAIVDDLAADRDRLKERVASLEQQLADVTGSIARQSVAAAAEPPRPETASTGADGAAGREPVVPVLTPPVGTPLLGSDVVFAPEIDSPISTNEGRPEAKSWPTATPVAALPGTPSGEASKLPGNAVPAEPPTDAPAAVDAAELQPGQGEPPGDPAVLVDVPLPRVRSSATSPTSGYAVDLGGTFSREALAARWAEVKVKYATQLSGLRPLVGLENRFGYAPYRLVIGPLADEAAARQLCTRLSGKIDCRPTRFSGDRLARH